MSEYKLTVLTDPIPFGKWWLPEQFKKHARKIKRVFKPLPSYMQSPYRGHPAVTRSLVEGLKKIDYPANYNPTNLKDVAETVIVLSGIETLKQAIQLKRVGKIKKLLAGPNILEFPADYADVIAAPEVDICITPCEWTNILYSNDCPALKGRLIAWPAGVDTEYWKPKLRHKKNKILIYEKQRKGPVGPVEPYKTWLESQGYEVSIIKCGEYSLEEFRELLYEVVLMIGFVIDESQGLAWAEAWSTDVPTLIWQNTKTSLQGRHYECSTAPYLNDNLGFFFDNFEDFKLVFLRDWQSLAPRKWVLASMSDEICGKALIAITQL